MVYDNTYQLRADMKSAAFIKVLYYVAASALFATLVLQLISVFGFDLTSLLLPPVQTLETTDPVAYFMMPILAICAPLGLVLGLGGRISAKGLSHSERGVKNLLGISFVYAALNMANAAIRLHGGDVHAAGGLHYLSSGDGDTLLSSAEYHRDMALMMSYFMSWAMMVLLFLAVTYRDWLRELEDTTIPML
jgi:hypothetical protein